MVALTVKEAEAHVASVFRAHRCSETVAVRLARALTQAQIDGQGGHGYSRVAAYSGQALSGKVDGHATPHLSWPRSAYGVVEVGNGFSFPALDMAVEALSERALETGIACIALRHSNHAGVLGHTVEALAERGFVAIMMANAPAAMAPWGGGTAIYGTNPIGFAAPNGDAPPVVVDLSLSQVARGKIMAASKTGDPIPEGWALDAQGKPTTDAKAALEGTMLPAGGAKGAALSLMVEVLSGALAGPSLSIQAGSFFSTDGNASGVGQFLVAIDPNAGHSNGSAKILEILRSIEAQENARLPGNRRLQSRAKVESTGTVLVPDLIWDEILRLPTQS